VLGRRMRRGGKKGRGVPVSRGRWRREGRVDVGRDRAWLWVRAGRSWRAARAGVRCMRFCRCFRRRRVARSARAARWRRAGWGRLLVYRGLLAGAWRWRARGAGRLRRCEPTTERLRRLVLRIDHEGEHRDPRADGPRGGIPRDLTDGASRDIRHLVACLHIPERLAHADARGGAATGATLTPRETHHIVRRQTVPVAS